jgi:hypothetical protein
LPAGGKFSGLAWQISQRHVDGTWQMTWGRGEFLELTHIDEDNASPAARRRCNSTTSIHAGASTRGRRNKRDRDAIMASTR